jgi:hypothetical protein
MIAGPLSVACSLPGLATKCDLQRGGEPIKRNNPIDALNCEKVFQLPVVLISFVTT